MTKRVSVTVETVWSVDIPDTALSGDAATLCAIGGFAACPRLVTLPS
jgi:hypothetical protein